MRRMFIYLALPVLLQLCGCERRTQFGPTPKGKVLLAITRQDQDRLANRLGFTNAWCSTFGRDSKGTRLFSCVSESQPHDTNKYFVVVSAQGAEVKSWLAANGSLSDDESLLVETQTNGMRSIRRVHYGDRLSIGGRVEEVSGDWVLLSSQGRSKWLARRDSPAVPVAEFPGPADTRVHFFADDQVVHVFVTRITWVSDRNAIGGHAADEESLEYLVYDFSQGDRQPIKRVTLPSWTFQGIEMDPETGMVVINSSPNGWRRYSLLDLNTGKCSGLPDTPTRFFVRKEVAEKWIELTR